MECSRSVLGGDGMKSRLENGGSRGSLALFLADSCFFRDGRVLDPTGFRKFFAEQRVTSEPPRASPEVFPTQFFEPELTELVPKLPEALISLQLFRLGMLNLV